MTITLKKLPQESRAAQSERIVIIDGRYAGTVYFRAIGDIRVRKQLSLTTRSAIDLNQALLQLC